GTRAAGGNRRCRRAPRAPRAAARRGAAADALGRGRRKRRGRCAGGVELRRLTAGLGRTPDPLRRRRAGARARPARTDGERPLRVPPGAACGGRTGVPAGAGARLGARRAAPASHRAGTLGADRASRPRRLGEL
ncbi:MAG: hypothetical protein AVDCRST_MAG67-3098, partial [uncultured Solirubrobacteraceae bacterium]